MLSIFIAPIFAENETSLQTVASDRIVQIPLSENSGWELLEYRGIKSNKIVFGPQGILIRVQKSASPLIFPLPSKMNLSEVEVSLAISGDLKLGDLRQGEPGADDFVFRLGLVHEGDSTLNFLQRTIAAAWIKKLYNMAPSEAGISHIAFYNIFSDERLAGKRRYHPQSALLIENFVQKRPVQDEVTLRINPETGLPVLALWVSVDGDDSGSEYSVQINRITLYAR